MRWADQLSTVQQVREGPKDADQVLAGSIRALLNSVHIHAYLGRLMGSLLVDKEAVAGLTFVNFQNRACQVASQVYNGLLGPLCQVFILDVGGSL